MRILALVLIVVGGLLVVVGYRGRMTEFTKALKG